MAKIEEADIAGVRLRVHSTDLNAPATNYAILYVKDGTLFLKLSNNTVIEVGDSGSYSLEGLIDVTINNPQDGDYLKYVSSSGLYVNVPPPLTPVNLRDLEDVDISNAHDGRILQYSSGGWRDTPNPLLDDIDTMTAGTGDTLFNDGTNWINVAFSLVNLTGVSMPAETLSKGDILMWDGSFWVSLPAGTDGYKLTANSSTATGLEWVV